MSHQDRREPLPKDYRFGDARLLTVAPIQPWIREAYAAIDGYKPGDRYVSRLIVNPDGTFPEQPFAPGLTLRAQGVYQ